MADNRKYPLKDVKLLFGLSAGRCAFPECHQEVIVEATDYDDAAVLGYIAHIEAHSDTGPRANPRLEIKQRDSYGNWILLCGHHHPQVDKQYNTFTPDDLRTWKANHETWVRNQLAKGISEITFAELEVCCKAILQPPSAPTTQFTVTPPREKMQRNGLTDNVHLLITLGFVKFKEVEAFVEHMALIDTYYPERLIAGFVTEYNRLIAEEYEGDSLFEALREFASGGSSDFQRQTAGLSVLVYLFHKCDIFER